MFKALAEYAMRGRLQAIIIALVGSWLPLISQGVLGLVTLRRGWQEGLLIALWASLPAFIALWMGQVSKPIALASIAVFFVSFAVSYVLRMTSSWLPTLLTAVATSAFSAFVVVALVDDVGADISAFFATLLKDSEGAKPEDIAHFIDGWTATRATGMIAYWTGLSTVAGVLLARWWQALVYNPGGFQQEFHGLRLSLPLALSCALGLALLYSLGSEYEFWSGLLGLPLVFAGLGLAHWLIARFKLGTVAVVIVYIAIPVVPFGGVIIMILALLDAALNLRNKLSMNRPVS